jgi:hypothetical protein
MQIQLALIAAAAGVSRGRWGGRAVWLAASRAAYVISAQTRDAI